MFRQLFLLIFAAGCLHAKPTVYDCFLFLNELEVLDIRLHEMDPIVDQFVIVESVETFRGNPKEPVFAKHIEQFKEFRDKIRYVVIDHHLETSNPWDREAYQRNWIMRGLKDCTNEDIILISDVDEIVQAEGGKAIYNLLCAEPNQVVGVDQRCHYIYINSVPDPVMWRGTVATSYGKLKRYSPQGLRDLRYDVPAVAVGWHFTYQGGWERELYKLGAFSHTELDTPEEYESRKQAALSKNRCPVMEIDDSFPLYIRENQAYFEEIGFILRPSSNFKPS